MEVPVMPEVIINPWVGLIRNELFEPLVDVYGNIQTRMLTDSAVLGVHHQHACVGQVVLSPDINWTYQGNSVGTYSTRVVTALTRASKDVTPLSDTNDMLQDKYYRTYSQIQFSDAGGVYNLHGRWSREFISVVGQEDFDTT